MESNSKRKLYDSSKPIQIFEVLQEVDWAFGRMLALLLNTIFFIAILALSLTSLGLVLYGVIEYQEGLADISNLELMFIIFSIILLKRYFSYTKKTCMPWWNRLTEPLVWYGKFVLICWLTASIFAFSDLVNETGYWKETLLKGENYGQMFAFGCILLSLYVSVPSKRKKLKESDSSSVSEPISTKESTGNQETETKNK